MDDKTLSSIYDVMPELKPVPRFISSNLKHPLRPYQQEAVRRWRHYMRTHLGSKNIQLLFNMATGSGKTLIMAALIIDLYTRGYRNFIYFVNSTNIIEKTRDNFTNPISKKYLFADKVTIDDQNIPIREVKNFSDSDPDAINIIFTTIQQLHTDLNNPSENHLSHSELEDLAVVLIGDEAHHNNTKTLMSSEDKKDNLSWESTVNAIMRTAQNAILLEFTATIDLDDPSIYSKYKDRIIYKYDLKKFRQDGYSKDVLIYHVDADLKGRMLQAIIISQYRKKVALRNGIYLKPVVLFKSKKIADNQTNFQLFNNLIKDLNSTTLQTERTKATSLLKDAFDGIGLNLADLADELKNDFMPERLMIIDGNTITPSKQLQLNSLEDESNEIRAIFAVDKLNEGWDVLNLFDIVRLYDTRDARNNKPGKTTIREAQLIGRGARYFPFTTGHSSQKYLRKYDDNEAEELRLLEQLHYHSAENPHYIQELRQALIASGIIPANFVEWTLHLKSEFQQTDVYNDGVIYLNSRKSLAETSAYAELPSLLEIQLPSHVAQTTSIFSENPTANNSNKTTIKFTYGNFIPKNITRRAISQNQNFRFNVLKNTFPALTSIEHFMDMMSKIYLIVTGADLDRDQLTSVQKLFLAEETLRGIEAKLSANNAIFLGTPEFQPQKISQVFKDVRQKYLIKPDTDPELGQPQSHSRVAKLDLRTKPWYIYNENYGPAAEKDLLLTFNGLFSELSKTWESIYLLYGGNSATLYALDDGRAVKPDYILLARNRKTQKNLQVFITLNPDPQQQNLLSQVAATANVPGVKIASLTFDNANHFAAALKNLAKES